jgi:peptide/nickel transport system ATP-binding protein
MAGVGHAHLLERGASLMRVEDLVVEFPTRNGTVHAVSGVSFDIRPGETLGLVGESGCGKSTTGRALLQLPRPTSGAVELEGTDLTRLGAKAMRRVRPNLQMIFQDPRSSLNARRSVTDIVSAGPRIWGWPDAEVNRRVEAVLDAVGLDPEAVGDRRPTTFSGGQCQRISIARALVLEPKLLICDEPVSALDVSVQAQILNLLADMKERFGITVLFISHDLGVVNNISDRVIVMYLGRICEVATPDVLFAAAAHPYTRLLVDSVPRVSTNGRRARDPVPGGELPSPIDPPSGCRFRTRCPRASEICAEVVPEIRRVADDHFVACHFPVVPTTDASAAMPERDGSRHDRPSS